MDRYRKRDVGTVGFATLTCSPSLLGTDLEAQFRKVKDDRLVSLFVREFRRVTGKDVAYLSVMEFHKKSKQVHFHLALDGCGKLPREQLVELQAWCQQHMGTFDYKYMRSERAIRYCLKYVTKGAAEGMPDWCLDYEGRIRPYSASRGFWHDTKPRVATEPTGTTRKQRTLRVRIEKCEDAGVVGLTEEMEADGSVRYRYAFSSNVPFETVRAIAADIVPEMDREDILQAGSAFLLSVEEFRAVAARVVEGPGMGRREAAGLRGP